MHEQTTLDGYELIAYTKRSEQSERIDIAPSALRTGADSRTRTDDLLITNELLYQLSHISIVSAF